MKTASNLYLTNIVNFIALLRMRGLKPGISETADSLRALELIGLESRSLVKTALGSILAKSEQELYIFSAAFDEFFTSLEAHYNSSEKTAVAMSERKQLYEENAERLKFQGERLDIPEDLVETYTQMSEEEKQRIADFLERTSTGKNVGPRFKDITENIIKGRLKSSRLHSTELPTKGDLPADSLLYKSISNIDENEIPQALRLIWHLVRRINTLISREYRRKGKRCGLDIKRTINKSISTGGILYKLVFRRRPLRKQRMLILCDVSGSMYRFSSFGLQFIKGMNSAADKSDVFIFSEGIEHIAPTDIVTFNAFEKRVTTSALWRRGTDIASALSHLLKERYAVSRSIVIIFSDAKTLNMQNTKELLTQVNRIAKKIIWMNPLPSRDWPLMNYLKRIQPYCTMLDCSTLDNLARACTMTSML